MHSCMFLSRADVFLGQSTAFGLALSSLALLGVGRRGGFYSHIVYTCSLGQLASAKCVFLFYTVYSYHLGLLGKNLRTLLRS